MSQPGMSWWHLILHTRGTWLHGDPKGFRSRGHRIHSSGDYKHRPPKDEHAGLYRYHVRRSKRAVILPPHLFAVVGTALIKKVRKKRWRLLSACVGETHAHLQIELPGAYGFALDTMGSLKQASSHAVRLQLPGRVWAEGGKPIPVEVIGHQEELFDYILGHEPEGAWVWSYLMGPIWWELDRRGGVDA